MTSDTMTSETIQATARGSYYSTARVQPRHLFPVAVERVFTALDALTASEHTYAPGEKRPDQETIGWAKNVLLRVLPSYYLRTAQVDAFQGEIHVSWERGNRRIVVFLPSPNVLKIYAEWEDDDKETKHLIRPLPNPRSVNGFLEWLYSEGNG